MHTALAEHETVGIDLVIGERLCDLEYADDAFSILPKVHSLFWTELRELSFHSLCALHPQCKVMYQDWDSPEPLSWL